MDGLGIVSAGGVTMLLIELLKYLWRSFVVGNSEYDFPPMFYAVAVPVGNILVTVPLAFIGLSGFSMPTDWASFGRAVVSVALSSLISFFGYGTTIKPLKNYKATYKSAKG